MTNRNVSIKVVTAGVTFENPFIVGSGPPTTNARVIAKAYELGWAGAVAKTISLDASKVVNVIPRYGKIRIKASNDVVGFQNIELISDRPIQIWLDEFKSLKKKYPNKVLIASIMEEYRREAWQEITERVQSTGVDIIELNLSCPHGLPERKMGMSMGEDPDRVREVTQWVTEVASIPVWVKTTPNVGDVKAPAVAAIEAGASGISAINTILSIIGVDLKSLRPMPTVAGYSEPGGYSGIAVRPIALRQVMEIARACTGKSICGIGGIESGTDAVQFMLLGASTVQLCTGVMLRGYEVISSLKKGLVNFMKEHDFESTSDFIGKSLPYFDTHAHLVKRLHQEKQKRFGHDDNWTGNISEETDQLTSNESKHDMDD